MIGSQDLGGSTSGPFGICLVDMAKQLPFAIAFAKGGRLSETSANPSWPAVLFGITGTLCVLKYCKRSVHCLVEVLAFNKWLTRPRAANVCWASAQVRLPIG